MESRTINIFGEKRFPFHEYIHQPSEVILLSLGGTFVFSWSPLNLGERVKKINMGLRWLVCCRNGILGKSRACAITHPFADY